MTRRVNRCSCCGAAILPERFFRGAIKERIWQALREHGPLDRNQLMAIVYADHPDGGPSSYNTLNSHINQMREQLAPEGLGIEASWGRYSQFRIVEIK